MVQGEDVADLASVSVSKLKVYVPAGTSAETPTQRLGKSQVPFKGSYSNY